MNIQQLRGLVRPLFALIALGGTPISLGCDSPSKTSSVHKTAPSVAPLPSTSAPATRLVAPEPKPAPESVSEDDAIRSAPLSEQRAHITRLLETTLGVSSERVVQVAKILNASDWASYGNPRISTPAMSRAECHERRQKAKLAPATPACGHKNMVALSKNVCIDQFEFPNVPCEYPLVWVRSSEADGICRALGKRLCDAHEWEGGCAGELRDAESEYGYSALPRAYEFSTVRQRRLYMEHEHNVSREIVWAYGKEQDHSRCATGARKDKRCYTVDWGICGSTTYPTGAFPECVSSLGVYDQHGNVAEHMSLPIYEKELGSKGGVGWTEMKGSWFIFAREQTHPDDCRWRAKSWHSTRIRDANSHRNYHLGFRCCADVGAN